MANQGKRESDRFRGCLLGLAAGDAVGVTAEFKERGSFPPIVDMVGGGPFGLEPGQWTDDTSMALCLAESLLGKNGFDADDQMRRYLRWRDEGYLSSTGACFDIGNTVDAALTRYRETHKPFSGSTHPRSAGNGSIMRLAPVPMFYYPDREAALRYAVESSRTTHAAAECLDACRLLAEAIFRALEGKSQAEILALDTVGTIDGAPFTTASIAAIARGDYRHKSANAIKGSGYVVESLEAALWCFGHTGSFEGAILAAANLGDDADTTAAICGQVAGAFYGESGIPPRWLEKLVMGEEITTVADRLREAVGSR
jgi:ADP-ribosyl-[dinitrogen reductase] hydrolase